MNPQVSKQRHQQKKHPVIGRGSETELNRFAECVRNRDTSLLIFDHSLLACRAGEENGGSLFSRFELIKVLNLLVGLVVWLIRGLWAS